MSPIKIRCACGNVVYAPEERVGQTGQCPNCSRAIKVELPPPEVSSHNTPQQQTVYQQTVKLSLFTRFLNFIFYIAFLLLLSGFIALHTCSTTQISSFEWFGCVWLKNQWQSNENYLLETKNIQQQWANESWVWAKTYWPSNSSHNNPATKETVIEEDNMPIMGTPDTDGPTKVNSQTPNQPSLKSPHTNPSNTKPRPKQPTNQPAPKTTTASNSTSSQNTQNNTSNTYTKPSTDPNNMIGIWQD